VSTQPEEKQPEEKPTSHHRNKLLFLILAGAASILLLIIGGYKFLDFSDSTAFCGLLCHKVMYPEYTAYQYSPHSRVACSQCHVGYGGGYLVRSKISGIPQVWAVLTNSYERPITTPVKNLRPARETCEQCHRPERFAGDLVVTHTTYSIDEANTEHVDTRVLRVGGGEAEVAKDIHWHIAANVWYLAADRERQEMVWVGVEKPDGTLTQYVDPTYKGDLSQKTIEKDKRLMDCIDCHNRATHIYQSPEDLIDEALTQGTIDKTLPYIKMEALHAIDPINQTLEQNDANIDAIKDYYRANYPQVLAGKGPALDEAIAELKTIVKETTFTHMKVNWNTYPDNSNHKNNEGCFRCHGKLVEEGGPQPGEAINADCNLCHYFQL
jgi:nitrate/TMAO reductase-like tetraheme cytochrome c subunit